MWSSLKVVEGVAALLAVYLLWRNGSMLDLDAVGMTLRLSG